MPIRIKTKDGVIVESDPTAIKRDGSQPPTANIPWNSKKITGLADGTDANDAINKGQLDSHTTDTSNPHSVTFTQAVTADGTTDISAAEAETLTDGSNADALHIHDYAASTHNHDDRYYTETELDAGQLDNRYYTETELDAGQLDNRYYRENEFINSSAGAGDAGKPVVLDAAGHVDASMINDGDIDHVNIANNGTNTHAQLDSHVADATIHFTEGSIDHTAITNIGTNSHAQIDTHIADATIHFTEGSIDHTNITNVGTNTHAQIDTHIASTANPHSVDIDDVTPTTTKGDIIVEDGSNAVRLGVGSNDQVLTADSSTATGLKWADASGGAADFESDQHILANQIFA